MYWLGFLDEAREAGELDWQAIGGTWGIATSRLTKWKPATDVPLGDVLSETVSEIEEFREKNGPLLARYVHKYFHDMWLHFRSAHRVLKPGGKAIYVVGNSIFFGVHVPTEKWYADLMRQSGFEGIKIEKIRKRNSKKGLFEYKVTGLA
jgi:SAM-dependent methyltransferase